MKLDKLNVIDVLGVTGAAASLTLPEMVSLITSVVVIASMLPVAVMRWRKLLRGESPTAEELGKPEDEKRN
jgi:hypothetical protein